MSALPSISTSVAATTRSRRGLRAGTVALAVLAPLVLWAIVEYAFGLDLRSPAFGDGQTADVGAVHVVVAALAGALAGLASLAFLERVTARAKGLWTAGGIVALLVSLGGPLGGSGVGTVNRGVLAAMHVVVALVLIVGFTRAAGDDRA